MVMNGGDGDLTVDRDNNRALLKWDWQPRRLPETAGAITMLTKYDDDDDDDDGDGPKKQHTAQWLMMRHSLIASSW